MSTIYDKTDNYSLNLYGDNDPADLRDGYNGAMQTIDTTLETHLNRIEGVESRETHDEEVIKALIGDNTVDNAATAKAKWDKAATDATNANELLTSMSVTDVASSTAFRAKVDATASNVNAFGLVSTESASALRNKFDATSANVDEFGLTSSATAKVYRGGVCRNYQGTIFGFIGDSITQGYRATSSAKRWSTLVSGIFGATEKNVAVGGTGFTTSPQSDRFDGQADKLVAAVGENAPVSIVFISGGVNDLSVNIQLGASVLESTVSKVRTAFPLARIIVTIGLSGTMEKGLHSSNKPMRERMHYYSALCEKAASLGCEVMAGYYMTSVNPSYSSDDGLHPNDAGYALISEFMASAVAGTHIPYDTQLKTMGKTDIWKNADDNTDVSIDYANVHIARNFAHTITEDERADYLLRFTLGTVLPSNRTPFATYALAPAGRGDSYINPIMGFVSLSGITTENEHRNSLNYNYYQVKTSQPSAGEVLHALMNVTFSTF